MSYKQGQKLVCVHKGSWVIEMGPNKGKVSLGPKYEEVVTVTNKCHRHTECIDIDECRFSSYENKVCFSEYWFIPLEDWNQMEEEIKEAVKGHTPIG